MAAVLGLADEEVEGLCAAADRVWPANYNCPGQVVISGSEDGVTAVADQAREQGAKVIRLRVAGAFHSPLMAPAAGRLEPAVAATSLRSDAHAVHVHRYQRSWRRRLRCPACWSSS